MTARLTDHSRTTLRKYMREELPPKARRKPRPRRISPDPLAAIWPRMQARLAADPRIQGPSPLRTLSRTSPAPACVPSFFAPSLRRVRA
jgi:hypothetical protein